jgi:hypothetical protein
VAAGWVGLALLDLIKKVRYPRFANGCGRAMECEPNVL